MELEPNPGRSTDLIRCFRWINLHQETIKFRSPMNGTAVMLLLLEANAKQLMEIDRLPRLKRANDDQVEAW